MNILKQGSELRVNQELSSQNGAYRLLMQADGNLVLYGGSTAVWATNTSGQPSTLRPIVAMMQDDGNFVMYSHTKHPIWATMTNIPGSQLELQDDRNLVIYNYNPSKHPIWATMTN